MNRKIPDWLAHHGVQGQKWGVRHGPPYPLGSSPRKVFISGTSKLKNKDSEFYRKSLPKAVTDKVDNYIQNNYHILIGDAPGIDTEIQKYLAKKNHRNVTVYTISEKPRFMASNDLGWGVKVVPGTEQVDKDIAMSKDAHMGFAIPIEGGAKATRNNINRMQEDGKEVDICQLNKDGTENIFEHDKKKVMSRTFIDPSNETYKHVLKNEDDILLSTDHIFYRVYNKYNNKNSYISKRLYVSDDYKDYDNDYFYDTIGTSEFRRQTIKSKKPLLFGGEKAINVILQEIGEKPLNPIFNKEGDYAKIDSSKYTDRDFLFKESTLAKNFILQAIKDGYSGIRDPVDDMYGFSLTAKIIFDPKNNVDVIEDIYVNTSD